MVYSSARIRGRRNNISKSYSARLHLKVDSTLKEIKGPAYDWNNIEKDIRKFYFKCLICKIRTSKPRKNYVVNHIESDYSWEKYQVNKVYLANYISNDTNI